MNANRDAAKNIPGRMIAATVALTAFAVWANADAWCDILDNGVRRADAVHIFLGLPLFAWLLWAGRGRFADCRLAPSALGLPIMLVGWGISVWGYHRSGQTLWHGGALLVAAGCVVAVMGKELLFRFVPAFLALGFTVPAPGFVRRVLEGPLETATAHAGKFVFDVIGMNVQLDTQPWAFSRYYIYRYEEVEVFVKDLCQRTQMFFVVLAVAYVFAFGSSLRKPLGRVLIFLSVPLLAIVCDVVRTVPTIEYYRQNPEIAGNRYHVFATVWPLVPVAFLVLWGLTAVGRWVFSPDTEGR